MIGASRLALASSARVVVAARNSRAIARRRLGSGAHGDDHHPHNVFEPPYNKAFLAGMALFIVGGGAGTMIFGFVHQQKKQGYWK